MGSVAEWFRGIVKGTKWIVQKVGAIILGVFVLGMLTGAYIILGGFSLLWFVLFGAAIVVTWNDFGEGVAITTLLILLLILFPNFLPIIRL